ncbi:MAG TPA: DMT family transporter [Roseimicrobium sp.]|nr:DMT family transporter [Roseimicrobium sp.]
MLPALLTTVLFSISAVCANRTASRMGGTEANFWRLCLATALLAIYAHGFGAGLGGAAFAMFFLSGCIGFGVGDVALFQALPRIGSRMTVLIVQCLAAPFAAISEWLWLGTTATAAQMLCSAVILAGVAVAVAPSEHLNLTRRQLVVGILFATLAAFGQGFGAVVSRKGFDIATLAGQNIDGISAAYQRVIGGMIVSGIFLLVVKREEIRQVLTSGGRVTPEERARKRELWKTLWWWIALNGLSGPALGVSCYQWALKTTPTSIVLPIVALTPLVVIPFTRYLEGEKPTWRSILGGAIAVGGVVALKMVS